MANEDFTKEFFQQAWGKNGYYENFNYGVGIDRVCEISLIPFFDGSKDALEIGCGGGVFTERMVNKFYSLTGIDVIEMPERFKEFNGFSFIELPEQSYDCSIIKDSSIDFCFCYNVFC